MCSRSLTPVHPRLKYKGVFDFQEFVIYCHTSSQLWDSVTPALVPIRRHPTLAGLGRGAGEQYPGGDVGGLGVAAAGPDSRPPGGALWVPALFSPGVHLSWVRINPTELKPNPRLRHTWPPRDPRHQQTRVDVQLCYYFN